MSTNQHRWAFVLASSVAIGAIAATPAAVTVDAEIVRAIGRGDCNAAVQAANEAVKANEARAIFIVGRMLDEGVCTNSDGAGATAYFARAAALGFRAAALDQGVQAGLGEGAEQSYARAGELCRLGGLPGPADASPYVLGYVCTLRGVASRLLRRALVPNGATARLSYNPASGATEISSAPRVTSSETQTGTYLRGPQVEGRRVIELAWRRALARVPKPDTALLLDRTFDVTLDLDQSIEAGLRGAAAAAGAEHPAFFPAEIEVTPPAKPAAPH